MQIHFPISEKEFRSNFFEKKPLLMKNAVKKENLLSWNEINQIFPRCNLISEDDIKVMYRGEKLPKEYYLEAYDDLGHLRYKFKEEVLYNFMRDGATLVANGIVNEPNVDIFSQEIANFSKCHTFTSLYIAFNNKRSFKSHWDSRDIFAVQMQGKKRWIIHAPTFKDPLFMHKSKDMPEYEPNLEDVYMDIILEAGDVLYLPRGWWHDPIPVGEETVHLAIGIFPPYANNYLNWIAKDIVKKEVARKSLFCYEHDRKILEELASEVSEFIMDKENYSKFIEEFYDNKRIEKPLNLEILGNHNITKFSGSEILSFPIKNDNLTHSNKIISNGYGITIDDDFKKVILSLLENDKLSVNEISSLFYQGKEEKLNELLWNLSYLGILKLNTN
ncbi:cupin domain-containing protein [Avibacterium volantium]|uniref:cupin domain-containing protein n=1 Tax=Avibacterium TaxID=292486 RepID=UPI0039FDA33B